MKKLFFSIVIAAVIFGFAQKRGFFEPIFFSGKQHGGTDLQTAYEQRQSNLQIQGQGIVTKILADDVKGSRHQRFILQLATGQTLLIAHNIDIAPRVKDLKVGDTVAFYGEYEWNPKGGTIHWTHHDPKNFHPHGWLKHQGRVFQ